MTEHDFQVNIVNALKYQFAKEIERKDFLITAVPNGGKRSKREAARLKAEGVLAGTSDLIISYFSKMFFAEVKLPTEYETSKKTGKKILSKKGYQSAKQKEFQSIVEHQGHTYILIDSWKKYEEFKNMLREVK